MNSFRRLSEVLKRVYNAFGIGFTH